MGIVASATNGFQYVVGFFAVAIMAAAFVAGCWLAGSLVLSLVEIVLRINPGPAQPHHKIPPVRLQDRITNHFQVTVVERKTRNMPERTDQERAAKRVRKQQLSRRRRAGHLVDAIRIAIIACIGFVTLLLLTLLIMILF